MLQKAIFLDRDGVLNQDSPDYIKNWSEFEFIPGSIDAIKHLNENGFTVFIITNQSIINRNMVPVAVLEDIHNRMKTTVATGGGEIKDIFFCPHTPEENCDCRKPKPGLIFQAKKAYGIDLSSATMVGDNIKDIECAKNAGCRFAVLVKTGYNNGVEKRLRDKNQPPDYIAKDLDAASRWIINIYKTLKDPTV